MYYAIYAELNLLCAAILIYLLCKLSSEDKRAEMRAFAHVVRATLVVTLLDAVWAFVEPRTDLIPLNYAINSFYLFDTALICYFWFIYIELELKEWKILNKRTLALLALPLAVTGALCIAAPFCGGLFYIDAGNVYHRGSLYYIQLVVTNGYILVASLHVCNMLRNAADKWERGIYLTLLSYLAFTSAGGVLSIIYFGLPLVWPASTISLLMVFGNQQTVQISLDALTGLNNRRSFDRYLGSLLSDQASFCLMMMDIDRFKQINDTYGHVEGDRALRETAQILKDVCGSLDSFLARFGGDEFTVILRDASQKEAEGTAAKIRAAFGARNAKTQADFDITVSIGIAENWPASTAEKLTAAADKKLYEVKKLAGCVRT